jgi:thiol-disulfide isomerase/thioredoxin
MWARLRLGLAVILALSGTSPAGAVAPAEVRMAPATAPQVLAAVRAAGARAVVVNVWASWCIPCREEFPALLRFYRSYKDRGVAVLFVSGDFASDTAPAKEFLAEQGVDFPSYLKAQKDQEFIDAFDPQWSGALPATFVYDGTGERRKSFLGPVTYESLEREVAPLLAVAH